MIDCYKCNGRGYHRKFIIKSPCGRCSGKGELQFNELKIVGVCLGWDARPHVQREDGTYLPTDIERRVYADYFPDGADWPHDPVTSEKLPIAK